MTTITLAKALKLKAKLAGDLNSAYYAVSKNNSIIVGNKRHIDINATLAEMAEVKKKLIELKLAITVGNEKIMRSLIELSELKDTLGKISSINTTEGKHREYGDSFSEFEVVLTQGFINETAKALKTQIEELQDSIDSYNHSTMITVPFEI